ncbi:hypothetical protein [Sphingomonas sp. CFBP 8760]|uniref:hypothetical protein n=1 Tax=Sphingomonas sp. CFBP 8760 TaxID=2775282 RepID=UPI00177D474D|nr:hypothetical protein [Sphingomonas sp. CFBP 8760]MBD8546039.1 hypothetical protein [Sphingomonas sp. CFBP 8760]
MPKKKPPTITLPVVVNPAAELRRPWKDDGGLVRVDAVYHVPEIHPSSDGPWATEADKVACVDPVSGYGCIIRRAPDGGHLCGYVSVPPGHPLFGREYGTMTGIMIGVHGGLDYSAACEDWEDEDRSVCHPQGVPPGFQQGVHRNEAADDDAWWFGFSCNKRTDLLPEDARRPRDVRTPAFGIDEPTYKTEAFVYGECVRLAAQMKAIEQNRDPRLADPGPTVIMPSVVEYRR